VFDWFWYYTISTGERNNDLFFFSVASLFVFMSTKAARRFCFGGVVILCGKEEDAR
jgi:hypothetical protein